MTEVLTKQQLFISSSATIFLLSFQHATISIPFPFLLQVRLRREQQESPDHELEFVRLDGAVRIENGNY
jgi:hypothetical protein